MKFSTFLDVTKIEGSNNDDAVVAADYSKKESELYGSNVLFFSCTYKYISTLLFHPN